MRNGVGSGTLLQVRAHDLGTAIPVPPPCPSREFALLCILPMVESSFVEHCGCSFSGREPMAARLLHVLRLQLLRGLRKFSFHSRVGRVVCCSGTGREPGSLNLATTIAQIPPNAIALL